MTGLKVFLSMLPCLETNHTNGDSVTGDNVNLSQSERIPGDQGKKPLSGLTTRNLSPSPARHGLMHENATH